MIHFFDDDTAVTVGLNGAIILNHLHYWIKKNSDNEQNYHDGYYWTYNSVAAFKKQFPFWSEKTIARTLKDLENDGYIKTGNYNQSSYDHTKWYALTQKAIELLASPIAQEYLPKDNDKDKLSDSIQTDCPEISPQNDRNDTDNLGESDMDNLGKSTLNKNKHKEKPTHTLDCSPELREALEAFAEHRKKLKKPMTDYAKKLTINKLKKYADSESEQIAILNQSIERGWVGVFPLKDDKESGTGDSKQNHSNATFIMGGL